MRDEIIYDLTIIGAGPAGMTAAVYSARKNLKTLIISADIGGQTAWSSGVENYLGYSYISGAELVQKFEEHLMKFDVTTQFAKVTDMKRLSNGYFEAFTDQENSYVSRAMVVTAGKSPKMLNIPGEQEYIGRGVTYCATCDAPLFSGSEVAVVGGGNSGLDAVIQLAKICPKVYLIESQPQLNGDEVLRERIASADNVDVMVDSRVQKVNGEDLVKSIEIRNNQTGETRVLPVKGVFVEIGLAPNTSFVHELVELNEHGEIVVDCAGRTGVPGLYAAGDVTTVPEKQIIIAAGEGAKAALGAYSYLIRLPESTVPEN